MTDENPPPEPEHANHPSRFRWERFHAVADLWLRKLLIWVIIILAFVIVSTVLYLRIIR